MAVKDVFAPNPDEVGEVAMKKEIGEVKQTADNMSVIDKTMETAKKLAGHGVIEAQLERQNKENEKLANENKDLSTQVQDARTDVLRAELSGKIDKLSEDLKSKGTSQKSIGDQLTEIKSVATELGMGTGKFGEVKEILTFLNSFRPDKSLADQIKSAQEVMTLINPNKPERALMPGDISPLTVELKKIDSSVQLQIAKMEDDRQAREHQFQLEMKKFEIETDTRKQEVQGKLALEQERNAMLSGGIERLGRIMISAAANGDQAISGPISAAVKTIEAGIGEEGAFPCSCGTTLGIAKDASNVSCPSCGTQYAIRRVAQTAAEEAGPII